ncbi:MAG: ABC-type transport auxiliary lipoprotein family protein [Rudaea sp.]
MRMLILSSLLVLLAACSPASVPDVTYFRMPAPTPLPRADKPLTTMPIVVRVFSGEGIYSEQALIYSLTPDAGSLRTYHYQLWSDPPSRELQSRLTGMLRDSGIAPLVTERLPASDPALRVHGTIVRYERIKRDAGYVVDVAFEIRVEQGGGEPVIEKTYTAEAAAADTTIATSVQAFGVAVDQVFAKFYADLVGLTHAG